MDESLAAWQAFLAGATLPRHMRPVILDSWQRCLRAGLPRDDGEPTFRRVPEHDLASRLEATRALRAAALPHLEWISAAFSDIPHAVYITDADGIVLHAVGNWPGGFAALGLEPGCDWSEATMGTNGAGTAVAADQPVAVIGAAHYFPAFARCTCTGAPLHGPDGRVIGAIDLSTCAEDARPGQLMLIAHVAWVIDQALRHEAEMKDVESLRLLARMSGFTAHELASPLTAVGNAVAVLRRLPAASEAKPIIEVLDRSSRQLCRVVEELRVLAGAHSEEALSEVDLAELARAVLGEVRAAAIETVLEAPRSGLTALCHPGLFSTVLSNLVRNACDAMPAGGTVGISIEAARQALAVTVWDDGPGIPADKLASLFTRPFTTKPHGSGLGLLLARAIVERVHGGELHYRPNTPRGSRFEIRLPLHASVARAPVALD